MIMIFLIFLLLYFFFWGGGAFIWLSVIITFMCIIIGIAINMLCRYFSKKLHSDSYSNLVEVSIFSYTKSKNL